MPFDTAPPPAPDRMTMPEEVFSPTSDTWAAWVKLFGDDMVAAWPTIQAAFAAAEAAIAASDATIWDADTAYTAGDVVFDPTASYASYTRQTNGTTATAPSSDPTNWARTVPPFTGGSMTSAINEAKATVASHASTADIWSAAGNLIDFTGTAAVGAFPAAPQAGARRRLLCAGACSFTHGANLICPGSANITAAAGDIVTVDAITTTQFRLTIEKADGSAVVNNSFPVGAVINATSAPSSGTWLKSGIYATASYAALAALLGTIADADDWNATYSTTIVPPTSADTQFNPNSIYLDAQKRAVTSTRITYITGSRWMSFVEETGASAASGTATSLISSSHTLFGCATDGTNVVIAGHNGSNNTVKVAVSANGGASFGAASSDIATTFLASGFDYIESLGLWVMWGRDSATSGAKVYTSTDRTTWTSRTVGAGAFGSLAGPLPAWVEGSTIYLQSENIRLSSTDGGETWTRTALTFTLPSGYAAPNHIASNGKTAIGFLDSAKVLPAAGSSTVPRVLMFCRDIRSSTPAWEAIIVPRGLGYGYNIALTLVDIVEAAGYYWLTAWQNPSTEHWLWRISVSDPTDIVIIPYMTSDTSNGAPGVVSGRSNLWIWKDQNAYELGRLPLCSYNPSTQFLVPPMKAPPGLVPYMKAA